MIATFILTLFTNFWAFAFQILPVGHLPAGVSSAITTTISWIWVVNPILDIPTVFDLFYLFLGIEITILGLEFFFWVYSKVPIFGKK